MRHIILDTETTGLDPKDGHRIVEIGCVELHNHRKTGRTFQKYINPQRDVPQEAFKVHGLSQDFLKDHPLFGDIAQEFLDFIQDGTLVIHNAGFDLKFLNHELKSLNFQTLHTFTVVDTLQLARQKFPGSPANLDALCKRFNISLSTRDKHGALIDCELLAGVYLELIGKTKQYTFELSGQGAETASGMASAATAFPHRVFEVSVDEKAAHTAFLKKVKNPLWDRQE
jgi:DNA polymerase III subunit epsilon